VRQEFSRKTLPERPAENTRPAPPAPPLILPFIHLELLPGGMAVELSLGGIKSGGWLRRTNMLAGATV